MSFVGFFPPASVFGSDYFAGTALTGLDIFDAVNACSEKGFKDEDIVLDVILTSAANQLQPGPDHKDLYTIGVIARYAEVAGYYQVMDGYLRAKFAYNKINFRYLIAPSGHIPSSLRPLKMTEEEINEVMAMGAADA